MFTFPSGVLLIIKCLDAHEINMMESGVNSGQKTLNHHQQTEKKTS